MGKYYVFRRLDFPDEGCVPNSVEAVACEIFLAIDRSEDDLELFIAFDEIHPLATFGILKNLALCSLDLDDSSLLDWVQRYRNIHAGAQAVQDALGEFYGDVLQRSESLQNLIDQIPELSNLSTIDEGTLDYIFDTMRYDLDIDLAIFLEDRYAMRELNLQLLNAT